MKKITLIMLNLVFVSLIAYFSLTAVKQAEAPSGAIVSLVDVDFAEYRRQNDMRTVKKNCTIPSWLNFAAERAGVNFSAILQAALKKELHITNR